MDLSLYFHCSWEYLPDKDDTYVTYIIYILSFLETTCIVLDNFQGQTLNTYLTHAFNSCTCQKKQVDFSALFNLIPSLTSLYNTTAALILTLLFG